MLMIRFDAWAGSVSILPSPNADPLTTGAALAGTAAEAGRWQERVFASGDQIYLAHESTNPPISLEVFGVDAGDPSAPVTTGITGLGAGDDESFLDALQAGRSLVFPKIRAGEWVYTGSPASGRYRDATLRYDIIDPEAAGAPRVASSFEVPDALVEGGLHRGLPNIEVDTPSGWQSLRAGAAFASGNLLIAHHSEATQSDRRRFFLDRLDVSDPYAPALLEPVNVPGGVIAYDDNSGSLVTLEMLVFEARVASYRDCEARGGHGFDFEHLTGVCRTSRRALNGLSLDAGTNTASLRSRLVLDDVRRALLFAVSGDQIFYVTEPPLEEPAYEQAQVDQSLTITLERLRVSGDGQLERLPSLDISSLHERGPRYWTRFVARGNRVIAQLGTDLGAIDFGTEPPRVSVQRALPQGCKDIDLAGDTLYCARGDAGVVRLELPSSP